MSSPIWWLVLGLLLGWLIEWVIDWVYWRRRRPAIAVDTSGVQQVDAEQTQLRDALASARADNKRLQSELLAANELAQRRQGDIDALNSRLAEVGDRDQLQAELNTATALAQQRQAKIDELEEQLARMPVDDKQLRASTEVPRPAMAGTDTGDATSANFATIQLSREEMASLMPPVDQSAADGSDTNDPQRLQEREAPQPAARRRDPLIDINGIGPVYEQKLFDAGVSTFEDLAALTPEQVREIIAPQRWQEIDPASWIAEARQFAQKKA